MVQDAERMREADEKRKSAVNAKNEAESLVYTVEKQITDMKDKITDADKEDLNNKIAAVRTTLTTDDSDAIQAKTKELQEASWKVTQNMYSNSSSSTNESDDSSKKFEEGK